MPDLLGNCGGFERVYGGNRNARAGYCNAVCAAVGAGTTVEVVDELELVVSAIVVGLDIVVVVESFEAPFACAPMPNEPTATSVAKPTLLNFCTLFL